MLKKLFLFFLPALNFIYCTLIFSQQNNKNISPPISPSWVFNHWVWEDDKNTEEAVWEMVNGYEKYNIPVGAIIIDSPWSTEYNNFIFDTKKYPNYKEMIKKLHQKNIRVVLWATAIINNKYEDGANEPKSTKLYESALKNGYLLNNGQTYKWWKGEGAFIDITNSEAVNWWHKLQDEVLNLGIDGYKVDEVGLGSFPAVAQGKNGKVSKKKYIEWYYKDFYEYGKTKNPEFVTFARSVDIITPFYPNGFSPINVTAVSWVGDERHNWSNEGFLEALSDIFSAAKLGYTVVGSDTAGYNGDEEITKNLLLRWTQFSSLCGLFENGGHGKHFPWLFDEETIKIYKYYVKLHSELNPYFYSLMMQAHQSERKLIVQPDVQKLQFLLGDFIFAAVIYSDNNTRKIYFPEGQWIDWWTKKIYQGNTEISYTVSQAQYPLFLKVGSIIPLEVKDNETALGDKWSGSADTFLIVTGAGAKFKMYGENKDPAEIKLTSNKDVTLIEMTKTNNKKIFIIENVKKLKEVVGNKKIYEAVKLLNEFAEKENVVYFNKKTSTLWIKSAEKDKLTLRVYHR